MKNKIFKFIILLVAISIFIFSFILNPTISGIVNIEKATEVQNNLNNIRIALENYYQRTGRYPELSRDGVNFNLELLNTFNDKRELVSFKIGKGNEFPYTEGNGTLKKSNKIIDSNNFNDIDGSGGWIYDYSGQSGEIHPNLPENIYDQNIKWSER